MFGSWYATKDQRLKDGGKPEQHEYARELLADLLERGQVIRELYYGLFQRHLEVDGSEGKMEYEEALAAFLRAAHVFFQDLEEATARARRARLVYGANDSELFGQIQTGIVDCDLDSVGGTLVPWDQPNESIANGTARLVVPEPTEPARKQVAR